MKKFAALCTLFLAACAPAEAPKTKITPVASVTETIAGQPIALPQKNPQVNVSLYEVPVGAVLSWHKHPYQRYAYILQGTMRVLRKDSDQVTDYHAGDFVVEMRDLWHSGQNVGDIPAKLLVIDQAPAGKPNVIRE